METPYPDFMERNVKSLADAVMNAVVASGIVTDDNIATSSIVMRDEMMAFFYCPEYEAARDALVLDKVSQQTVVALVVASCIDRIYNGDITIKVAA